MKPTNPTAFLFLSVVMTSLPAFSEPVGPSFSSGCPEAEHTDTCMPGTHPTGENAAGSFILAETAALAGEWSTNPAGWHLTAASCPSEICNDDGERAYVNTDFLNHGRQVPDMGDVTALTAVSVPAALGMSGAGMVVLAVCMRRRVAPR